MDATWQRCLRDLRDYRPADQLDLEYELRLARRDVHARACCVWQIAAYVLLAAVLVGWVTGFRDWFLAEISDNPVWGIVNLTALFALVVFAGLQVRLPDTRSAEDRVRQRYAPADGPRFRVVEPMLDECPEVRQIVMGWIRELHGLRNVELERLEAAFLCWQGQATETRRMDTTHKAQGKAANG